MKTYFQVEMYIPRHIAEAIYNAKSVPIVVITDRVKAAIRAAGIEIK